MGNIFRITWSNSEGHPPLGLILFSFSDLTQWELIRQSPVECLIIDSVSVFFYFSKWLVQKTHTTFLINQIRTKTNHHLDACFFPRLSQLTCLLTSNSDCPPLDVVFCSDWLLWLLWFWFFGFEIRSNWWELFTQLQEMKAKWNDDMISINCCFLPINLCFGYRALQITSIQPHK